MEIVGGLIVLTVMIVLSGIKVVKDSNRLVVYRLGKVVATKGAGVHLILPILESADIVDTRMMMMDTPPTEATTLDEATVTVSVSCMFQIADAKRAVTKISNAPEATMISAQKVLIATVRQNDLKTLQSEQKGINKRIKISMEKTTREWGINIKSVEIKSLVVAKAPPSAGDPAGEIAAQVEST